LEVSRKALRCEVCGVSGHWREWSFSYPWHPDEYIKIEAENFLRKVALGAFSLGVEIKEFTK
jgi:hypothetical protein